MTVKQLAVSLLAAVIVTAIAAGVMASQAAPRWKTSVRITCEAVRDVEADGYRCRRGTVELVQ